MTQEPPTSIYDPTHACEKCGGPVDRKRVAKWRRWSANRATKGKPAAFLVCGACHDERDVAQRDRWEYVRPVLDSGYRVIEAWRAKEAPLLLERLEELERRLHHLRIRDIDARIAREQREREGMDLGPPKPPSSVGAAQAPH